MFDYVHLSYEYTVYDSLRISYTDKILKLSKRCPTRMIGRNPSLAYRQIRDAKKYLGILVFIENDCFSDS